MNTPLPPPSPPDPALAALQQRASPASIRRRGWVLIVIGPLLSGGIAALAAVVASLVNRPTPPGGLPSYTGSHALLVDTFELFGLLFVFGLVSLANGVYQVRHSRQSRPLLVLFFLVLAAIIGLGIVSTQAAKAVHAAAVP